VDSLPQTHYIVICCLFAVDLAALFLVRCKMVNMEKELSQQDETVDPKEMQAFAEAADEVEKPFRQ